MSERSICFVVMPFHSSFTFFFLYLQHYMDKEHQLDVIRGDTEFSTEGIIKKVRDQIGRADVIVGDITGSNANVFFELGIAYTLGKPIILLTQDPVEHMPTDLKYLELIPYDMGNPRELLGKLDKAIVSVFVERYRAWHVKAKALLVDFNNASGTKVKPVSFDEFRARVNRAIQAEGLPVPEDAAPFARFALPRILFDPSDIDKLQRVRDWLDDAYPSDEDG